MTTIVLATMMCDNMHLTQTRVVSPVLHTGGVISGSCSSDADFCQRCDSSVMTIMGFDAAEVEGLTELEESLYKLRHDLIQ